MMQLLSLQQCRRVEGFSMAASAAAGAAACSGGVGQQVLCHAMVLVAETAGLSLQMHLRMTDVRHQQQEQRREWQWECKVCQRSKREQHRTLAARSPLTSLRGMQ